MKTKIQVQYNDLNVETVNIEKLAKEDLKAKNIKMNTIETLEVYYKPIEAAIYYVATLKDGSVIGNDEPLIVE